MRNCTLELYQGKHIRLAVTKWGKLSMYPDNVASTPPPPSKMNEDRNFSLIDLSVVASEMANVREDSPYGSGSRQSKNSSDRGEQGGNGSSKSPSSKSGHSTAKHQQPQSSKRNSRSGGDRRQSRGKNLQAVAPMNVHYGGIKQDSRQQQQQQPHPGQVIYHPMPGFTPYDQGMGMRQYPHAYASRQDVSSQQIMMQQQQYDIQQRQLQHMYGQDIVHRHEHQLQQAPPQMMVRTMGSFDTTASSYAGGEIPDQRQVPLMTGASPLLMPMGIPPPGTSMTAQTTHEHQYPSPPLESHAGATDAAQSPSSGAVSPFPHTLGKMNPDASAYTPTYLSAAQGEL